MKHARASWLLLLCGGSAFAHHGNSEFDLTTTVRYEGTIVEMRWINPHTVTTLATHTATGEPITLEIEGSSPSILRTGGFSAGSLLKGEPVTAVVSPSRRFPDESAYGYEIIKADGTVVPLVSAPNVPLPLTLTLRSTALMAVKANPNELTDPLKLEVAIRRAGAEILALKP